VRSAGAPILLWLRRWFTGIKERLACVFVNNGLLRQNEAERVCQLFAERFGQSFRYVDAGEKFLTRLEGVEDPEEKRRRIGHTFIEVFEEEATQLGTIDFLAQGTLYPDVIESVSLFPPPRSRLTTTSAGFRRT
jgi:GMP synthase (glutamine-hydrolysing)